MDAGVEQIGEYRRDQDRQLPHHQRKELKIRKRGRLERIRWCGLKWKHQYVHFHMSTDTEIDIELCVCA